MAFFKRKEDDWDDDLNFNIKPNKKQQKGLKNITMADIDPYYAAKNSSDKDDEIPVHEKRIKEAEAYKDLEADMYNDVYAANSHTANSAYKATAYPETPNPDQMNQDDFNLSMQLDRLAEEERASRPLTRKEKREQKKQAKKNHRKSFNKPDKENRSNKNTEKTYKRDIGIYDVKDIRPSAPDYTNSETVPENQHEYLPGFDDFDLNSLEHEQPPKKSFKTRLFHRDSDGEDTGKNNQKPGNQKPGKQKYGKKTKKEKQKKTRKITKNQELAMQQIQEADYDGFDPGRMIELPEWDLSPRGKRIFGGVIIIAVIFGLLIFGYYETDFDTDGNPTVVSLETRNERMYVNRSDELLQEVIDCASYIENDTADMSDYITVSSELQDQYNKLNSDTTELSKYVDVPSSMEAYHTKLLNVSLGVQTLQKEIIQNYQASDYSDWRASNIASMESSLETLHDMRFQIDERIWGNTATRGGDEE